MACLETGVQWRETADRTGEGDTSISPKTATALMIYSGRGETERRHFEQDYRELLQKTTLLKLTPLRQARHVSKAQSLTACSAPCQRENEWWQKGVCSVFTCVGTYTGNCWSYWNKWQCSTQFTQPYHCQLWGTHHARTHITLGQNHSIIFLFRRAAFLRSLQHAIWWEQSW